MNKITKLLLAIALGISLGYGVNAARSFTVWNMPVSQNGRELSHPGFEGKSFKQVVGGTATVVCTGKCLLYDVLMSSGAATDYETIIDSSAVANASVTIADKIMFTPTENYEASLAKGSGAFPILCNYGITVDQTGTAGAEVLVIYKDLD